jgi:GMP synthase (glutamine-hydrolysing)
LARATGATYIIGTVPGFDWCKVQQTPEGLRDPVLAGMGPRAFQWHSDTFTLPAGAVQLAGSSATAA